MIYVMIYVTHIQKLKMLLAVNKNLKMISSSENQMHAIHKNDCDKI